LPLALARDRIKAGRFMFYSANNKKAAAFPKGKVIVNTDHLLLILLKGVFSTATVLPNRMSLTLHRSRARAQQRGSGLC
jgi:hypothetical protein